MRALPKVERIAPISPSGRKRVWLIGAAFRSKDPGAVEWRPWCMEEPEWVVTTKESGHQAALAVAELEWRKLSRWSFTESSQRVLWVQEADRIVSRTHSGWHRDTVLSQLVTDAGVVFHFLRG